MEYMVIYMIVFLLGMLSGKFLKEKLSLKYPVIELLNGIIYVWVFALKGVCIDSILFCVCTSVLLMIGITDWRTYEIPFVCNIVIGILGLIRLLSDLPHWYEYVIGFFAVSSLFYIIRAVTKGKAMGGGDVKLMAAAGLLLGWKHILLALMIGSIAGSVIHLTLMKLKDKDRVLAFGPYLAFGIFVAMLYGDGIINWYLKFCGL